MNAEEYLKLAGVEDRMWYFRALHSHVEQSLAAVGLPENSQVLDAGCGTGGLIIRARQWRKAFRWIGIDFMALACQLARERCGPAVDIREANITALPFAAGTFDAVISLDVVSMVYDPEVAIAGFFRVLRPGGVAVINLPAYMWMWSYHDDAVHTKRRYTRREVADLLRAAGFTVPILTHWNSLLFPLVWARRKLFRAASDTSDVKEYPGPIDAVLGAIMSIELAWIRWGGVWPWGTSVLAVARKPQ